VGRSRRDGGGCVRERGGGGAGKRARTHLEVPHVIVALQFRPQAAILHALGGGDVGIEGEKTHRGLVWGSKGVRGQGILVW